MTLSDYLAEIGQKPSQFAESLGMPASTILRIINGRREARIGTAAKIVEATGGKVGFADLVIEPAAGTAPITPSAKSGQPAPEPARATA